jgi:hypothetical protein
VLAASFPAPGGAATIDVGSGPVTSRFVLQSPNLGLRDYRVHHAGSGDAHALLQVILTNDLSLTATFFNFGTAANPNYFVNSIAWSGVTETNNAAAPWFPYWAHWVAGGQAGFPTATAVAPDTWTQGSGISHPYRVTAEGSWDALVFSDGNTPPDILPIPEPESACLLAAAAVWMFRRRCRPSPAHRP